MAGTEGEGYRAYLSKAYYRHYLLLFSVGCTHPGEIDNGIVLPDKTGRYALGSEVIFACQEGYFLDGAEEIFCTDEMTWSSELPTCLEAGKS